MTYFEKFKDSNKKSLDQALSAACYDGELAIVKYVLTSDELKEHANIHYNRDNPFYWSLVKKNLNIIEYLIFEFNIEKTSVIEIYLKDFKDKETIHKVKEMFDMRDNNKRDNL